MQYMHCLKQNVIRFQSNHWFNALYTLCNFTEKLMSQYMYLNSDLILSKKYYRGIYGFAGLLGKTLIDFFSFFILIFSWTHIYSCIYICIYSRNLKYTSTIFVILFQSHMLFFSIVWLVGVSKTVKILHIP